MSPDTNTGLNNIIVHPAAEAGWARIQNHILVPDQQNCITALRAAVKCLRGAIAEPRFEFLAGVLQEYENLLDALMETGPGDPEYLIILSILGPKIAGLQDKFLASCKAHQAAGLHSQTVNAG